MRASSAEGVVTALRAVIRDPDGPYTLLSPLTRPAQLERLRLVAADFTVTSSIAESCLGQAAWHRYWYEPLVRATFATVLGDVPINNWIQWIEDAESSRVRGCVDQFSPDDSRKPAATEAMVLVADALDRLPRIFCGSPHMTEAFAGRLQTSPSIELEIDEDIVEEGGETLAVVGRLVDEEPWFDRLGLASFGLLRSAAHAIRGIASATHGEGCVQGDYADAFGHRADGERARGGCVDDRSTPQRADAGGLPPGPQYGGVSAEPRDLRLETGGRRSPQATRRR